MTVASPVLVGMSDIAVAKGPGLFSCLGLGSCIGLCLLDPVANVGGMAHIMLPEQFSEASGAKPGKFADTAVPEIVSQLERLGARFNRLLVAIAGGAQVFRFGSEAAPRLDIGRRNTSAVIEQLSKIGLRVAAQDVGGTLGRTVTMTNESGIIRVKTVSQGERTLCNLRG